MYEYLKGKTIYSEEHMLSCTEIAECAGLMYINSGAKPNSRLVTRVLDDYARSCNLNIDEIWYLGSRHPMRVYPRDFWEPALNSFIYDMNLDAPGEYVYNSTESRLRIKFYYKGKPENNNLISFKKERK